MPLYYQYFLQGLFLAWQFGLVETFTVVQVFYNAFAQYGSVVLGTLPANHTSLGPRTLLTPITGMGTTYRYLMAAQTVAERRERLAAVAAMAALTCTSATTGSLTTNVATGALIASKLADFETTLKMRGGALSGFKNVLNLNGHFDQAREQFVFSLKQIQEQQFANRCKIITQNIFDEHTARRAFNAQNLLHDPLTKIIGPSVLHVIPLNSVGIIGWSILAGGVISVSIVGSLYIFQLAKRRRYEREMGIIDTVAISCENENT